MSYLNYSMQAYEILRSDDMKAMENFLSLLFSSKEPQRSHAYNLLHCCKTDHATVFMIKLMYVLRCTAGVELREMAARTLSLVEAHNLWTKLPPEVQSNLKPQIIECLRMSDSMLISRIFGPVVSGIMCQVYREKGQWQQLLLFLVKSVVSDDESRQEITFLVFSRISVDCRKVICEALEPNGEILHNALIRGLSSNNPDVYIAASGAVIGLVSLFPGYTGSDKLGELFHLMQSGVFEFLRSQKEAFAQKGIEVLIRLVKEAPEFLMNYLNNFVSNMIEMFSILDFKYGTENLVVRFLMSLAESEALEYAMLNLSRDSMSGLLMLSMKMVICIEDDVGWYDMDNKEGENAGMTESYGNGLKCLIGLSMSLGKKNVVDIAFSLVQTYVVAEDWKLRHAGITTLGVIANGCSDEMVLTEDYLERVVTIILRSFDDPHPRVCWAAFNFTQLQNDLVGAIQILHHSRLLPKLLSSFDEHRSPRVKQRIAVALLHFIKNVSDECLTTFMDLDVILDKFFTLLKGNQYTIEERIVALCTFNMVAQKCPEVGLRHYADYIPAILEACTYRNLELKREAANGIRICAQLGGSAFKPFVRRALLIMLSYSNFDFNDPGISIIHWLPAEALSKLATIIGFPNQNYPDDAKGYAIAVSGIGKICEFHHDVINTHQLIPTWLNFLPVRDDWVEAKVVHEQLCSMAQRSDPEILGPDHVNLQKIVVIFLEVLSQGNNLATIETTVRMREFLRYIWANFPRCTTDMIFVSLSPLQQDILVKQALL